MNLETCWNCGGHALQATHWPDSPALVDVSCPSCGWNITWRLDRIGICRTCTQVIEAGETECWPCQLDREGARKTREAAR